MNREEKRKRELRQRVYNKFNGHCAYCGRKLEYKEMQVDHVKALLGNEEGDKYCYDNFFPSCKMCNQSKRALSVEEFRNYIQDSWKTALRYDRYFRLLDAYGLIKAISKPVTFYFEQE